MRFVKQTIGHLRSAWNCRALGLVLALAVVTVGRASAQNLVPNPDFEAYSSLPGGFGDLNHAIPWNSPTNASPDYFHAASSFPAVGVPANFAGNQSARSGNAYAGFFARINDAATGTPNRQYREYVETPLSSPLVAGQTYQVSFYLSLADASTWAVDKIGAYLSMGPVGLVNTESPLSSFIPQVNNPVGNYITNKTGWTLVTGLYLAAGGEDHLVIGNFFDNTSTLPLPVPGGSYSIDIAYYYLDDVSVIPLCVTPPSGMVAWYPLDEQTGATAINDIAPPPSSTVNNVGTPKPGPVSPPGPPPAGPAPVAGQVGGALYFYGPYIEVAPQAELDFSTGDFTVDAGVTAFSIDAWVRIVQVGPTLIQPIVDKFISPGGPGFAFYIRNQRLELNLNGSTFISTGLPIPFANPLLNTGPWVHVAVTVQGGGRGFGQVVFYINGVLAGTFTPHLGSVNNGLPLWIGETRVPGPRGEIAIDELEIFNRALVQSEIQSIYNAGSAGKCKPSVTLAITPSNPTTNPFDVTLAVNGCFTQEMFLVLNAPSMGIPWSYLNTNGAWAPLPTPLSLITPWMSSGPADGLYTLFSGSVAPGGPWDLYLVCDFVPNGHLDIDADLNLNGVFGSLLNVTVQ